MLNVIVFILAFTVVTLYGVYYYRVKQRQKVSQTIIKTRLLRVERIKNGFKADLERLTEIGVLSEQAQNTIYRLVCYYFVFQPATAESTEQCELVLKCLLMAIHDKLKDTENNNPVFIRLHLDHFARALPRKVAGYTALFYHKDLPLLIQQLVEAKGVIDQESDALI